MLRHKSRWDVKESEHLGSRGHASATPPELDVNKFGIYIRHSNFYRENDDELRYTLIYIYSTSKNMFFWGVLTVCLEVLTVKRIVWNQWPLFSHCICLAVTSKKQQQWPVMNLSMDWLENLNGKPWFLPSNMSFPANYPFIQFWKYHDLSISITWACREWQWSSQGSKM